MCMYVHAHFSCAVLWLFSDSMCLCSSFLCVCDRHFCVRFHECSGFFSISTYHFNYFVCTFNSSIFQSMFVIGCFPFRILVPIVLFAYLQFVNFGVSYSLQDFELYQSFKFYHCVEWFELCPCVSMCVCVCVCLCVYLCVSAGLWVFAPSRFSSHAFTSGYLVCVCI